MDIRCKKTDHGCPAHEASLMHVRGTTCAAEGWTGTVGLSVSHPVIQRPLHVALANGKVAGLGPITCEPYTSSTRLPPPHSARDRPRLRVVASVLA